MVKTNRHIIQKQIFNLTLRKSKDSASVQQKVSTICKNQLTPLIDKLFSRLVNEDELIRIDKLEIDIGTVSPDELEKVLSEKIAKALEEKILSLMSSQSPELVRNSLNTNQFEAWLVYLEKGILPWQLAGMEETDIHRSVLESLASNPSSLHGFRKTILQNQVALDRLVKQSDEDFIGSLLKACFGTKQSPLGRLRKDLLEVIIAAPLPVLEQLFAIKKITPRLFFLNFWKQTIYSSFQADQPVHESLIVSNVVKSMSARQEMALALLEIAKAIQGKKNPLEILKVVLLEIEQKQKNDSAQEEDKPLTDEESKPTGKKEERETINKEPDSLISKEDVSTKDFEQDNRTSEEVNETLEELRIDEPVLQEEKGLEIAEKDELKKELKPLIPKEGLPEKEAEQKDKAPGEVKESAAPLKTPMPNKKENKEEIIIEDASVFSKERIEPENVLQPKDAQADFEKSGIEKKTNDEIPGIQDFPKEQSPEGSHFYVQNAGIVLLHPFFKTYFKEVGLIKEDQFKDRESQQRAVHLLHYMAGGKDGAPEYDLVLPKFLCHLPFNFPLDREVKLGKKEKEEADQLLQAVIDHWGALGRVKPDSLQQGFLQREGKLEKKSGQWSLMIERQTIDILLDKLPWGISLVKLPWMPDLLSVEWIS